jgi:hypothetical protein
MSVFLFIAAVPLGCAERDLVGERHGGSDPLPKINDIESMEAIHDSPALKKEVKFAVPQPHWSKIRDALVPATRDDDPAKWVWLGELEINKKGGGKVTVWLFTVSDGPGAFAIGETWEHRVYYRGGESTKLEHSLRTAYEASR